MALFAESAPPKVNLTLRVRGRRPDGYHHIESLIAFARDTGDIVALAPGTEPGVRVSGPFAAAIAGENLLERALDRLAAAEPRLRLGAVTLEKRLPVAAGIGGGSADAAALLRAVRRANPELAAAVDWMRLAASLGADVPVCLEGEPAFVWGVGDKVAPMRALPPLAALLVNPLVGVPPDKTARVFARLEAPPARARGPKPDLPAAFADAQALLAYMRVEGNDLLAAATGIVPEVAPVRDELARLPGCRFVGLSGAGPTCFAIFADLQEAEAAAAIVREQRPGAWVVAAMLG